MTELMSEQSAPVIGPSPELSPGPHEHDGFPISFWTYVEPSPDRIATADACSAMLPNLHNALRSYPGELPAHCGTDVPRGLEPIDRSGDLVDGSDADLPRASAERLRPVWEAPGSDARLLHGDAHPSNLIVACGGELLWIDFGDVCLGRPERDLATMMDEGDIAKYHDRDLEVLARCTELRTLQVALALIVFRKDFGDMEGWDVSIRSLLDMFKSRRGYPSDPTNG